MRVAFLRVGLERYAGGWVRRRLEEWNTESERTEAREQQYGLSLKGNVTSESNWKWCGHVNCFQMMNLNL